ncbi:MAG: hypothetical protein ACYC56_02285 [Candidatus Aquicultor sp.]
MRNLRRIFALAAVAYLIASLVGLAGVFASSSAPLSVDNAKGESLTVGSVSVSNDGSNLSVVFSTDSGYRLNFTEITFRGNPGGVTRAMSDGRTQYLTSKSDNNHSYSIPLSEIKNSDVTIFASADVVVNNHVTHTKKAFMNVEFKVPETERSTTTTQVTTPSTTCSTAPCSTSSTAPAATSTTVAGATSTTAAPTTSTTVAPTTSTTQPGTTMTVLASTTSTSVIKLVTTTTRPTISRKRLPFTGMEYNWYLIGIMLALTGMGLYAGSIRRSN